MFGRRTEYDSYIQYSLINAVCYSNRGLVGRHDGKPFQSKQSFVFLEHIELATKSLVRHNFTDFHP